MRDDAQVAHLACAFAELDRDCSGTLARLDVARVEHHAYALADRGRGQVVAELGAHVAVVAVRRDDLPPDAAVLAELSLRVFLQRRRLVHVRDALAHVELRRFPILHTLELQSRLLHMLVPAIALVSHMDALHVQPHRLGHCAVQSCFAGAVLGLLETTVGDTKEEMGEVRYDR